VWLLDESDPFSVLLRVSAKLPLKVNPRMGELPRETEYVVPPYIMGDGSSVGGKPDGRVAIPCAVYRPNPLDLE